MRRRLRWGARTPTRCIHRARSTSGSRGSRGHIAGSSPKGVVLVGVEAAPAGEVVAVARVAQAEAVVEVKVVLEEEAAQPVEYLLMLMPKLRRWWSP